MYGLIGKMTATPGQRDALVSILLESVTGMPGCLSYIVANDPKRARLTPKLRGFSSQEWLCCPREFSPSSGSRAWRPPGATRSADGHRPAANRQFVAT